MSIATISLEIHSPQEIKSMLNKVTYHQVLIGEQPERERERERGGEGERGELNSNRNYDYLCQQFLLIRW